MSLDVVKREKQTKEWRSSVANLPIWRTIAQEEKSRILQKSRIGKSHHQIDILKSNCDGSTDVGVSLSWVDGLFVISDSDVVSGKTTS